MSPLWTWNFLSVLHDFIIIIIIITIVIIIIEYEILQTGKIRKKLGKNKFKDKAITPSQFQSIYMYNDNDICKVISDYKRVFKVGFLTISSWQVMEKLFPGVVCVCMYAHVRWDDKDKQIL